MVCVVFVNFKLEEKKPEKDEFYFEIQHNLQHNQLCLFYSTLNACLKGDTFLVLIREWILMAITKCYKTWMHY